MRQSILMLGLVSVTLAAGGALAARPPAGERAFVSPAVEAKIAAVAARIGDPTIRGMFEACYPNTLDTTVKGDGYVITGDIDAMWLRDSSAQVWPYLRLLRDDPGLKRLVERLLRRQFAAIRTDPYANAFYADAKRESEWKDDFTDMKPGVHERKWEIDSLCYPVRLAYGYWQATGDESLFDAEWEETLRTIVTTFRTQQRKGGAETPYRFQRLSSNQVDTLGNGGYGAPVNPVGLIASSFRPSDDATVLPFLVPSNFFAVDILRKAAEISDAVRGDPKLAAECRALADEVSAALRKYAVVETPEWGKVYAFEIDGFGGRILMDDANAPSLLSLPYLCGVDRRDPVYCNTRRMILSPAGNPYYFRGTALEGIGSPHTGYGRVWPMSVIMRILTAEDDGEIKDALRMLVSTTAGTGFMHEAVDVNDPEKFSRSWFAWANTLFGEAVIDLVEKGKAYLFETPAAASVLVEAEAFAEKGGWALDQQFMDQMGSAFLLAHGLGRPVADAVTQVTLAPGEYKVWVRTRDWVSPQGPGRFKVVVPGRFESKELGVGEGAWHWEDAGTFTARGGEVEVRLRDLTGFEGRCDAIFFATDGERPPEGRAARKRLLGIPEKAPDAGEYEFVVVGGGYAGMCAAVAAARLGVKTAIIQDRPVFGGNGSSEVRVGPIGELDLKPFPRNSDLMHEINELSRGEGETSGGVRPKADDGRIDRWMRSERDLACFTSTRGVDVELNADGTIAAVIGVNVETGRELRFPAKYFCDATGDAWLAIKAGAEVRTRPETREETGETLAAKKRGTPGGFGSTNYWLAKWTDEPVAFPSCPWAHNVTAESVDVPRPRWPVETDRPYVAGWNWESGFGKDAVADGEWIRDNNFRAAYGTWDYYKNKATNRAAYAKSEIEWMGYVTGKRDAKRIVGDYVLCEQDLTEHRVYPDGCVTTTWYLDLHFPHPYNERHFPGCAYRSCAYDDPNWPKFGVKNDGKMTPIKPYPIPFRCLYSKSIANLFMAGKDISVTHVALASVRVENTTGQMGTVVGRAVPLCLRNGWTPRELATEHFDALRRQLENPKREVWLFLAPDDAPDKALVAASVAWMGEQSGALVDSYFETYRDGMLFAASGSSIISGRHFQDFDYLCAKADVKIVRYGKTCVFDSTALNFGLETLAAGETATEIYRQLLWKRPALTGKVKGYYSAKGVEPKHRCYLYIEVAHRRLLHLPDGEAAPEGAEVVVYDGPKTNDLGAMTSALADKWNGVAKSVFFGDPASLECRTPAEIRRWSLPLFADCRWQGPTQNLYSAYAESESPLIPKACELATALGDKVLYGRQTADGDLFRMSHYGCSIQILDPYRPTFPCLDRLVQRWNRETLPLAEDDDPSDEQLREWAKQGRVLTTLLWHSGEIAHNEAMLNVIEFAQMNRFKMGIGVHAQRYETCPQLWELLNMPSARGGAAEYIEPILYSGGLGIMAEAKFPPEQLKANIAEAERRIAAVAGERNVPTGYQAFMDSDLRTCLSTNPAIWRAAGEAGMKYFISSSAPGRTRILYEDGNIIVINQSYRIVEASSPFVRVTSDTDVSWDRGSSCGGPGWIVGTLDAPVIAFTPYMWQHGNRFKALVEKLKTNVSWGGSYINVKPRVIARYARILGELGMIPDFACGGLVPPPSADGNGKD